jgi:type IV pilus assembly protein PilC
MPSTFYYTARTIEGAFVSGVLEAADRQQALAHLRMRDLAVTSVGNDATRTGRFAAFFSLLPISSRARNAMLCSLATLVRAGVPLLQSLRIVTEQASDKRLQEALRSVSCDVEAGLSFSSALSRRPSEFPRLFVAMIRAGERAGALDDVLVRIADLVDREHALGKRIRAALSYPAVVGVAALALLLFLITSTVPAFADLFEQMHVAVPLATSVLIRIGVAAQHPMTWAAGLVTAAASLTALMLARRSAIGTEVLDRVTLAIPFVGALVLKGSLARYARTLGALLSSGVPLLDALPSAAEVVLNRQLASAIQRADGVLREGGTVAMAIESARIYDPVSLALLRVGEETGMLDRMLERIAEHHELDVETTVAALTSVIEPCLIIGLGAVIGTIVGSILIPLYAMIGSIK